MEITSCESAKMLPGTCQAIYPNFCVLGAYIVQQHFLHPRIAHHDPWNLKRPTGHREIQQRSARNPDLYMVVSPSTRP